ncbi:Predicted DNA-binding transcriptional regulator YafY, contains an HTH and WYL domains [Paraburkholderia susongensis]|uniref:Predicted DNA-binding transcriptional regulator YafY, contains an HTH and WYL domains n=1 Tax=Paraburkholderia susongensis TaxID=1515439 RepID=A0A1X7M5Y0_9BURK|nr:Predicted DNA-binding transcriptional regulator YafY, contains an HTH and WYL domains [Paraburkholderia susongensis]
MVPFYTVLSSSTLQGSRADRGDRIRSHVQRKGACFDGLSVSRSQRLFDLMQVLRRHRGAVSGEVLAQETGVSLRTLRRDVATLQAMGADIDGAPGVGYLLRPGFLLPPLSFTEEELQALVAGVQWVSRQTDNALARAAQNALAKIGAVLSSEMREALSDDTLYVGRNNVNSTLDLTRVRQALREQRKMHITYEDHNGVSSERTIWPIVLGFVEPWRYIAAWCELREEFRLFRVDRIVEATFLEDRYSRSRRQLVKEWRALEDSRQVRQGSI